MRIIQLFPNQEGGHLALTLQGVFQSHDDLLRFAESVLPCQIQIPLFTMLHTGVHRPEDPANEGKT